MPWLQVRVSSEEAEIRHMVFNRRLGPMGVPFGFMNEEWKALLARMVQGDQLWEFRSPDYTWPAFHGRAGIAVVREGKVVAALVTRVS